MKPLERFPLPDYLQWYMERNIGRVPIWQFPDMPAMPNGIHFKRLNFENRHHFLAAFQEDSDEWVDERFKDPKARVFKRKEIKHRF